MGLFSRRPTPLPRTSYGYVPPPEATASGWKCTDEDECGTGGQEIPRRWPYRCPNCGAETDPEFNEPWAHQARGAWLTGKAETKYGDPNGGPFWQSELEAWNYNDAQLRAAGEEAHQAQERLHALIARTRADDPSFFGGMARVEVLRCALSAKDLDSASDELKDWLRDVPTDKVEHDNSQRTNVRQLIGGITAFAEKYPSHTDTVELVVAGDRLVDQALPVLLGELITRYRAVAR